MQKQKMPRDPSQLAKLVVDMAAGEAEPVPERVKDPAAVELGRKGGLKAAKLSPERRREIAIRAARARWSSGPK